MDKELNLQRCQRRRVRCTHVHGNSNQGWKKVQNGTWKVTLTNSFFGEFNPFKDVISGDWFQAKGRTHHTGCVYLHGHWLREAAQKGEVFQSTAEQIGLIGTHWSKGWIIENNIIRYTSCVGVTLGKYGDEWDNRAESAYGYNQTIQRALENGWSKENIGHHTVRNNHILHCGQAGIVGSMGAVFSTITGNEIHDLFMGTRISGI